MLKHALMIGAAAVLIAYYVSGGSSTGPANTAKVSSAPVRSEDPKTSQTAQDQAEWEAKKYKKMVADCNRDLTDGLSSSAACDRMNSRKGR